MKLRTVVLGLGKQSRDDHLPALMQSEHLHLVAVCDSDQKKVDEVAAQYQVPGYSDLAHIISEIDFQVAIVSVPHHAYLSVISTTWFPPENTSSRRSLSLRVLKKHIKSSKSFEAALCIWVWPSSVGSIRYIARSTNSNATSVRCIRSKEHTQ